ncbi:hypothetical protein INT46_002902, partial [Mucor plumbeus]
EEESNNPNTDSFITKYDINYTDKNIFTKFELYSLKLKEIMESYMIPKQAGKDITYHVQSMLRDSIEATKTRK